MHNNAAIFCNLCEEEGGALFATRFAKWVIRSSTFATKYVREAHIFVQKSAAKGNPYKHILAGFSIGKSLIKSLKLPIFNST